MSKRVTTEDFIEKARAVHGEVYDYSKVVYTGAKEKVIIGCPIHGEFPQDPNSHTNGRGCPRCGRARTVQASKDRRTPERFLEEANTRWAGRLSFELFKYSGSQEKSEVICLSCGKIFEAHANYLLHPRTKHGCSDCARKIAGPKISKTKQKPIEKFISDALVAHGDRYDYSLVEYRGSFIEVNILCNRHGVFSQLPHVHLMGCGCIKCAMEEKAEEQQLATTEFMRRALEIHGDKFDYSKVDLTSLTIPTTATVSLICKKHNYLFSVRVSSHIAYRDNNLGGCLKCRAEHNPILNPTEEAIFISRAKLLYGDSYSYENYESMSSPVTVVCREHGAVEQLAYVHLRGGGCPKCSRDRVISGEEEELSEFVSTLTEIDKGNRSLLKPFELDIICHERKIAIEYNGLYWHSEDRGKHYKYHLNKLKACEAVGYRLISIFSDEWLEKKDLVKSLLTSFITKQSINRIGARECLISELTSAEANEFYKTNHLQGQTKSGGTHLGLLYDGNLVALATVGASRFDPSYDFELVRFCTDKDILVMGALPKLMRAYRAAGFSGKLLSYIDRRWFTGKTYAAAGFVLVGETAPGFFYTKGIRRVSRQAMQKHKLVGILREFDPALTADENIERDGWSKIYDCGNWIYRLDL